MSLRRLRVPRLHWLTPHNSQGGKSGIEGGELLTLPPGSCCLPPNLSLSTFSAAANAQVFFLSADSLPNRMWSHLDTKTLSCSCGEPSRMILLLPRRLTAAETRLASIFSGGHIADSPSHCRRCGRSCFELPSKRCEFWGDGKR